MSTYRLTDNDRETLERRRRLYESIVSAYEGRGEAWITDASGDTLAWVAAGAAVPVVEAIIAPIHARAEEAEAAGTEVARQMLLQVEAHRARAEAAEKRADDLAAALAALADVAEEVTSLIATEPWDRVWRSAHQKFRRDLRALLADPAAVLADRDRHMKAEAWDEGNEDGWNDSHNWYDPNVPDSEPTRNPYREGGRADD